MLKKNDIKSQKQDWNNMKIKKWKRPERQKLLVDFKISEVKVKTEDFLQKRQAIFFQLIYLFSRNINKKRNVRKFRSKVD